MLLTIEAELSPGEDLGYLLHKHPDRVYCTELPLGKAHLYFPAVSECGATAALWLEVDPVGLVRRKPKQAAPSVEQYVNDRPYVASSLLSVAIARCLGSALKGRCESRPELAERPLPLRAQIAVIACRGGPGLIEALFAPLGYTVEAERLPYDPAFPDWGESPYYRLGLSAHKRLSELLSHLYVLLPVLDRQKHYGFGSDEVDKLLRHGQGWLEAHPAQTRIAEAYLGGRPSLLRLALERLLPVSEDEELAAASGELALERPISLNERRLQAVSDLLSASGVQAVADLGCGEGRLLKRLLEQSRIPRLIGLDVSTLALERAERRLLPDWLAERQRQRIELMQGSVLYRDARWRQVDAALLIEVIEHLEPFQLERLGRTLFGEQQPELVVITTPNREYNPVFGLLPHQLRHGDHRFEWSRQEFGQWCARMAAAYGYAWELRPIGDADPEHGPPTQMAVFTRLEAGA